MKKLFYALMFAAAALMSGCVTDEPTPEIDLSDTYMGLEMTDVEVYYRGDYYGEGVGNYIVYVDQVDGDRTLRRAAFELNTDSASETTNVPVGTFSVEQGNMVAGNAETFLTGSYYLRQTDSPFYMLIDDATLTITENEDGTYTVEAAVKGDYDFTNEPVTGEPELDENDKPIEPEKFPDFEFRCTTTPVMTGLNKANGFVEILQPAMYNEQEVAPFLFAYYSVEQGFACWEFELIDFNYYYVLTQGALIGLPATASTFTVYKQLTGDEELDKTIPTGTIMIDGTNTGYLNTALGAQVIGVTTYDGQNLSEFGGAAIDGSYTIKVMGNGVYEFSGTIYCADNAYTFSCTAPVYFNDLTEVEMAIDPTDVQNGYQGLYVDYQENVAGNHWVVTALDSTNGLMLELKLACEEEEGFDPSNGIPSGTYSIADNTLLASSCVYNYEGNLVTQFTSGEITINNMGSGVYNFEFELTGNDTLLYYGSGYNTNVVVATPSIYNFSDATAMFVGGGGWYIDLYDMTKLNGNGLAARLLMIAEATNTFADGLPAGDYRFDITGAPGTILPGTPMEGSYYYSMLISADGNSLYALFADGKVGVTREGENYSFDVNISDTDGNIYRGTYSGAVYATDMTANAAPAKVYNPSAVKWSSIEKMDNQKSFNPNIWRKPARLIK